ncbi:MAG TPA: GNAT family N-acetyltransferase [Phycisphaerae bacterium]|nr:GNAT family N-acetyltransferase [Phycisphaerae bacterium]
MAIELVRAMPEHAPQLSRILFHAFKNLQDLHSVPLDIPTPEVADMGMNMFVTRPDIYGVAAKENGKIVGHNFVQLSDPVAGVGPICVDPGCQSRGVGKLLMQHIDDYALKNHGPMVRLLQEAINMTSLSLYTSLGYALQEPILKMTVKPAAAVDESVRPLMMDDLATCDALCRHVYKVSRKNELAAMIQHGQAAGVVPHGRFVHGKLAAYVIPGFFGYAVAESAEDLLVTAEQAARSAPPLLQAILIPARHTELFTGALKRGWRSEKLFNLMSIGPYESPTGAWAPSIAY